MTSVSESLLSDETIYSLRNDVSLETYSLVWLDGAINCQENLNAQEKLRLLFNHFQAFEEFDQCKKYIHSVSAHDQIVLIVNGRFSEQLISDSLQLRQIFSIYIYCANKQFHQEWSQNYNKIKGVHNQLEDLINQIELDHSERRRNKPDELLSISVFNSNNNREESTTGLDGRFVQKQLLISCLLKMETIPTDTKEFASQCRLIYKDKKNQLELIDEFEKEYEFELSLSWYAKDSFLYRLLNSALRIENIDLLFLFGFFIRDMNNALRHCQYREPVRVYRGQLMATEELNILKDSKDKLISVNSFLSTSSNREVALHFLGDTSYDNKFERVLFEIEADPNQNDIKPFASLVGISKFDEEEILMMLGSIFRIKKVYLGENQIWHIEMNLCSDTDCDLRTVFSHMTSQYSAKNTKLLLFANVLIDMAHFDYAEKYLLRLLKQLPSKHEDIYKCYHGLGKISFEKGNYQLSLNYLHQSVSCILEKFKSNDLRIGYIYNSIGEVYQKEGDTTKALEAFEQALAVFKETFDDNHDSIAWCYNNLGNIYQEQNNYSQALHYLSKAFNIKKNSLPPQHPCLGNTYNNLANLHYYLRQYDQALQEYQLSYEIFHKSLTPRHPSLARILRNIGIVYEAQANYEEAKKSYEKATSIREKILSSTHPDIVQIKIDIQRVSSKI